MAPSVGMYRTVEFFKSANTATAFVMFEIEVMFVFSFNSHYYDVKTRKMCKNQAVSSFVKSLRITASI